MPSRRVGRLPSLAGAMFALALGACDRSTPRLQVTTEAATPTATPPASGSVGPGNVAPRVVALDPPNGALDVDPTRPTLAVTFDRAMDREGWSWVIEDPQTAPELGEAAFDAAARINTVQARLAPGRTYVVWVNSAQYSYFRSAEGVPVAPLRWTFTTRSAPGGASAPAVSTSPPQVVRLEPANGATEVDPSITVLRATFDRPMEASWSWVTEGSNFPEATGKAYFEPDARTAAMPVRLEPGHTYVIWLNSEEYRLFRDLQGTPAQPLRWVFSTRPAG